MNSLLLLFELITKEMDSLLLDLVITRNFQPVLFFYTSDEIVSDCKYRYDYSFYEKITDIVKDLLQVFTIRCRVLPK